MPIAESITGYGRRMLEMTQFLLNDRYTKERGHKYDATVIYGDTDSIMVNCGDIDMKESIDFGIEAAKYITSYFPEPVMIKFEKVFKPFALVARKCYAALPWKTHEKYDPIECKGVEAIRRDTC